MAAHWSKILFIIINIIFAILGICMIGVGIAIRLVYGYVIDVLPRLQNIDVTTVMIAAGTLVLLIAIVGVFAAWFEHLCVIGFYIFCVLVIIAMEIAAGAIAYLRRDQLRNTLQSQLYSTISDSAKRESWDLLQKEFECCGVNGPSDWYRNSIATTVPDSCCEFYREGCGQDIAQARTEGCYTKASRLVSDNLYSLGAAGITLAVLPVIVAIVAIIYLACLARAQRHKPYKSKLSLGSA